MPGHQGDMLELPSDKVTKTSSKKSPAKVQSKDRDMGAALRSAYQRTVDENVPDDLLDLLNKLA
ncbi:NepR family anti-sigma factor [Sphingomonas insulae]|uniref:Anti-sigma factor NepR domain-containing protein n=2 Tax=Sphingomonas insulae TaxID=424800 RepID=A0ABP3T710_9SPHN|nr:NepR family anti-sigma factor [Sphingomonas insulae]